MHDFTVIISMLTIDYFFYIIGNKYLKIWKDYDMYYNNFFKYVPYFNTESI